MAYIKLINKKYKVEIQKKGFPRLCRRFHTLGDARKFARDIESSMEGGTFEDYSGSSGTTLKSVSYTYPDFGIRIICYDFTEYKNFSGPKNRRIRLEVQGYTHELGSWVNKNNN